MVDELKKGLTQLSNQPMFLYLSLGEKGNEIITESYNGVLAALGSEAPTKFRYAHHLSEHAGHYENPYISVPKALSAYYQYRKAHTDTAVGLVSK